MSRNNQVTRLLKLLGILSNRTAGATVGELVREMRVTPRTIYRDFDALQEAGFPLYSTMEDGDEGGSKALWRFVDGYRYQVPIPFSLSELMSLHFFRGLIKPLAGTSFDDGLISAMEKVRIALPEETKDFVERVEETLKSGVKGQGAYGKFGPLINLLSQAVMNGERLALNYFSYSSGKATKREVDPYRLYYFEGTLYLIGHCHKAGEVRTFAVERIRLAEKTGHSFKPPKDFSIEEYFKHSFGVFRQELTSVEIRFDAKVAPFIRSKVWHPSQEITSDATGGLTVRFRLAGTREIKSWVMGFAEHAEVIAPDSLRKEIARDLEKMASLYENSSVRRIGNQLKIIPK